MNAVELKRKREGLWEQQREKKRGQGRGPDVYGNNTTTKHGREKRKMVHRFEHVSVHQTLTLEEPTVAYCLRASSLKQRVDHG